MSDYLAGEKELEAVQWLREAARIAGKALCLRAKCGAVIVKNCGVIGEGYNAPPLDNVANRMCNETAPNPEKPKSDRTCCMHAEWRAIMDALRRNPERLEGSALYFTRVDGNGEILKSGKPYCTVCSRMALDAGIAYFVLWHEEGMRSYGTDEYNKLSYRN